MLWYNISVGVLQKPQQLSVILTKEMSNAHDNAPHISFTILLAEHFFPPIITNTANNKNPKAKIHLKSNLAFRPFQKKKILRPAEYYSARNK